MPLEGYTMKAIALVTVRQTRKSLVEADTVKSLGTAIGRQVDDILLNADINDRVSSVNITIPVASMLRNE